MFLDKGVFEWILIIFFLNLVKETFWNTCITNIIFFIIFMGVLVLNLGIEQPLINEIIISNKNKIVIKNLEYLLFFHLIELIGTLFLIIFQFYAY